jgi:hypothetical protein
MTSPSGLEIARENASFELEQALAASAQKGHRDGELIAHAADRYHLLGIVALLTDADPKEYARLLALAGQADVACRSLGATLEPETRMASRSGPFEDALAAGDLDTAREIARLSPDAHEPDFEYEDDYLKTRVLHVLLLEPDGDKARRLHARWEEVLEGQHSPSHELSRVLIERDAGGFASALAATLASSEENFAEYRKSPEYRIEFGATDGALWVEGLAYLRIAELRGLPTEEDYSGMPSIARVPVATARPAPGAWLKPF